MKTIILNIIDSFHNSPGGFSARKLSAFAAVCIASIITCYYADAENVVTLVLLWLVFALLCLGIITAEHIIRFRNNDSSRVTTE